MEGIIIPILTLHTICQPYIKRAHNIIDALLLTDLALINSLSFLNYHKSLSQGIQYGATISPAIVQLVILYLPLVVMGSYLLVILCKIVVSQICKSQGATTLFSSGRANKLRELVQSISTQDEDSDSIGEEFPYRLVREDDKNASMWKFIIETEVEEDLGMSNRSTY